MSKEQEAFNRLFQSNYVGGLFTGDGYPIEYSQAEEEKDWELVGKAIDDLELYKKVVEKESEFIFDYRIKHNWYHKNKEFEEKFYKKFPKEIEEMFISEARKELENGE